MRLILIRHGEAVEQAPGSSDSARWLTAKGRKTTRRVAKWLAAKRKRRPGAIWSSAAVRAVQTAEIVAERCGLTDDVTIHEELAVGADIEPIVRALASYDGSRPLALVGHEPSLSLLAKRLLAKGDLPELKKSGVIILSWSNSGVGELETRHDPKSGRRANGHRARDESVGAEASG